MTPHRTVTFWDERFGDRYVIEVDAAGHFVRATRHLDRNPSNGIEYHDVDKLPAPVRHQIETLISQLK